MNQYARLTLRAEGERAQGRHDSLLAARERHPAPEPVTVRPVPLAELDREQREAAEAWAVEEFGSVEAWREWLEEYEWRCGRGFGVNGKDQQP